MGFGVVPESALRDTEWTRARSRETRLQPRIGLLRRPVWLLTGGIALLLLLAFGLLVYSSWQHARGLDPLEKHLDFVATAESIDDLLRELILQTQTAPPDLSLIRHAQRQLAALRRSSSELDARSVDRMSAVEGTLASLEADAPPRATPDLQGSLVMARLTMRRVLAAEIAAHNSLLVKNRSDARREQHIALGLVFGLLMVSIPLGLRIRHNIITPLDTLGHLMTLMSRHDYTSAPTTDVDPMLLPLFENYNRMVNRLVSLEKAHLQREESLTVSVRRATRILLQQQHRIAQAERLGAVGEIAASVAHELRNPLTAVHMALQNLARDLSDPDHIRRVHAVIDEVKRTNQQLNLLLDSARQTPEPMITVNVTEVLKELRRLMRYQINERIAIAIDAPDDVTCRLPEVQFRQCLINLISNSAQLLGEGPGLISITVSVKKPRIHVVVEDDGPGFPAPLLETGVRAFGSWRSGGTGLGLVMVRRFATDLGGNLRLENREPRGARVVLELPCDGQTDGPNPAGH
jgi:two-component system NtrC family sensor kinase